MGKTSDSISPELRTWLGSQWIFFVSTAPSAADGHINCSPKGGDTFRVLSERVVAYLDLTGSGIETIAHFQENGRVVIMFCAFAGAPRIVRLHGKGEVVYPGDPGFNDLLPQFPKRPGVRSILRVHLTRVSDSCGFATPMFDYVGERDTLDKWCETKGPEGLADYRRKKNQESIDGIPGYRDEG